MCKIEPYINPLKPESTYYQATYGNETYHHNDKAIVKQWLIEQVLTTPYKKEKQRITNKAAESFYNK
jgi:hypothetical protein